MSEHTPTPWNLHRLDRRVICAGRDRDGDDLVIGLAKDGSAAMYHFGDVYGTVRYKDAQANAAFIVRAVNAHDDLVKALEAIRDWPEPLLATTADAMREVARAALALASKGDDR